MKDRKKIEIFSRKAYVGDPCYDTSIWCTATLENVKSGLYNVHVEYSKDDRVSELYIVHELWENKPLSYSQIDAKIGVDSGQVVIHDFDDYCKIGYLEDLKTTYYEKVCEQTLSESAYGTGQHYVASSSGYGDGVYSCFVARDHSGDIVAIKVDFMGLEDSEEFEEIL